MMDPNVQSAIDKLRRYAASRTLRRYEHRTVTLTDDEALALLDWLDRDRPDVGYS